MCSLKINDKEYEFSSLEKKYSNFRAPAFKILIDKEDIVQKKNVGIEDVFVENCVDKADAFSFSVVNSYRFDKSNFEWAESLFVVGKKIEIKFGYIDKFATVFEGYITSVKYDFSRNLGACLLVSGMDSSFLMMKGKKSFIWSKKKHSDIVSDIARKHKLKTEIKSTDIEFDTVIQNQQTDYDFLKYLADLNSYEMFILGSTLHFRKINSSKDSLITLEMNKHLINFNYSVDLADQIGGVVVRGYNIKKEEIEVKCEKVESINSGSKNGVAILRDLDKNNTLNYIYEPIISKKEAENIAESMLIKNSMNFVTGEGTSIGIPEIMAGRYIKIKGLFGVKSKIFYVISASQSFDSTGYSTYFKIGGNAI